MLQRRYNQSGGYHIVQMIIFCKVEEDGKRSGHWQYGYDGRDFLYYNMDTSTWIAADMEAQEIKRKWERETAIKQRFTAYMESTCMEWLQKNDRYGLKLRKEPPVVTMSSRTEVEDGMETHICCMDGFYPRDIDATWRRDGEVWLEETFHTSVAPNADGTYHYWMSIQIDPKERSRYRCHVEHDGLQEPLDMELKVPGSKSNLWLIIGSVVGVLVACGVAGILLCLKFKKGKDEPRREPGHEPVTSC
ncbi:PREDICTED: major histocompatibility complex class I-related gene protein-like [Thamnophis sirtalis]|uniref:Major histocompatibility complex class I-related gene protein-like n=1 Tax=Thamnophis sirtalis TaxID=35019 RepID=A0A6I9YJX4_9SAUR|nr:PREDICTED: major histocompatibility complex class I-related gene protein-like [Thamnophis sirtalis]